MKNHEMFSFVRDFQQFKGLDGFEFVTLLNRNKRLFEKEIKLLQDTRENNSGYREYVEKVQEIMKELADRDGGGQPIIDQRPGQSGGVYRIKEKAQEFEKARATLITEYKEAIDKQDKLNAEFDKALDKEAFCSPYMIKEELVPKGIRVEQMDLLFPLIKFKEDTKKEEDKKKVAKKKD